MDEKISIRIKYSPEDYIRVWTHVESQKFEHKRGLIVCPVIFLSILAFAAYQFADRQIFFIGMIPAIVAGIIFYFIYRMLLSVYMKRGAGRQIKSAPEIHEENIVFSDEGIERTNNAGKQTTYWEAYFAATESETDFFFYVDEEFSEFIPKRVFESEFQQNQIRELAKNKLGEKAKF